MQDEVLTDLPLRSRTSPSWAARVLADPLLLLNDHAHLEKKAAANALDLLNRWPDPVPPETWVQAMCAVARDEAEHLSVVTRLLARRGGRLSRTHQNTYAADLRQLVRLGRGREELTDRLLISALIEARSCERFAALASHPGDAELTRLYRGLFASEAGHYRVFLSLAQQVGDADGVAARWDWMLDQEAAILARQPARATMHSGEGSGPSLTDAGRSN